VTELYHQEGREIPTLSPIQAQTGAGCEGKHDDEIKKNGWEKGETEYVAG
jgi:hypothetical protein